MNLVRCTKNKPLHVSEIVDELMDILAKDNNKKIIEKTCEEMEKDKADMLKYRFDII